METPFDIAGFSKQIFSVAETEFETFALKAFHFQATTNPVYGKFLQFLDVDHRQIDRIQDIPFLPVELFKSNKILSGDAATDFYFESSGTTATGKSKHYVSDLSLYRESILQTFRQFYGEASNYCFLFLLPSYHQNPNASLIFMCDTLMENALPGSGFFPGDKSALINILIQNEVISIPTFLIGVSYALLDLAESFQLNLKHTIVMETGGMKGRREELTREELHARIKKSFGIDEVHSEYGMTELLSMAYSTGEGKFQTPLWMKILIRDPEDPLTLFGRNRTGCLNVVDLANINSCSFLATRDLGKIDETEKFEVLGRYDNSDIRGCNLLIR